MATEEHAVFSASGSERWLNCPGSIELCKKAPPARESEYATEGTRAHKLLEFLLKHRDNPKAALQNALKNYPAGMVDHVWLAFCWILEEFDTEAYAELLTEMKVNSSAFTCDGQFGTLDAAIVRPLGRLTVIDYKHGAGVPVDVVDDEGKLNSQLVYYALGVIHLYPDDDFKEVELVIIQPRAYHESGDVIRRVVVPIQEIRDWEAVFQQGVRACKSGIPPLKSGKWCRWCAAAPICPELKEKAMKQAQIVFSESDGITAMPDVATVKIPNLSTMLEAADRLEAWIKRLRDHAYHVLEIGGDIDGWKLVEKRAQRRWKDEDAVKRDWGTRVLTEPKVISPAEFERRVKTGGSYVEANTTRESSGTTLVRAADKRAAVVPIEKVFAVVPTALQGKLPAVKKRKTK